MQKTLSRTSILKLLTVSRILALLSIVLLVVGVAFWVGGMFLQFYYDNQSYWEMTDLFLMIAFVTIVPGIIVGFLSMIVASIAQSNQLLAIQKTLDEQNNEESK